MRRFMRFDPFDRYICDLTPLQAKRDRQVGSYGIDSLSLTLVCDAVDKYDRVVAVDSMGRLCEWVVMGVRGQRTGGLPVCIATCYGSLQELSRHFIPVLRRGSDDSPAQALAKVVEGTRWTVGACDTATGQYSFYHTDSVSALKKVADAFSLEVEPHIHLTADRMGIAKREVSLVKHIGRTDTALRFDYGYNLTEISRIFSADDIVTRLYCYGKGIEKTDDDGNATGGYSRKITFADINDGKEYVEDASLLERYGIPFEDGLAHSDGIFEDGDCEEPAQLLAEGREELKKRCMPSVSYEGTVEALGRAGFDACACDLGDNVQITDTTFPSPLRLSGRVLEIEEDMLLDGTPSSITLGNIIEGAIKQSQAVRDTVDRLAGSAGSWDSAASLDGAYLNGVIDGLNRVMNETGGYTYIKPGEGIYVYDAPEDKSPTMCIQIGGGYFRIADGKNADGSWKFRTLGNGHGLVADELVAGTINANLIKAGTIQDVTGLNHWNLETGEFSLSARATVDGSPAAGAKDVIKSFVELYAIYEDGTGPAEVVDGDETGWSEDAQSWKAGYSIWRIKKYTMADGKVRYSVPELASDMNSLGKSTASVDEKADAVKSGLSELDETVTGIAEDGIVTEAEAAAVKKVLQSVEKESSELTSQYNSLHGNKSLGDTLKTALEAAYDDAFNSKDGASVSLRSAIDAVCKCKTSTELDSAMLEYESAYSAYSLAVKRYADAARDATSAIERASAEGLVNNLDKELDQQAIFDRLTNNGATQGIYMKGGLLYINATYLKAGIIADAKSKSSWNLETGELKTDSMTANNIKAVGTFQCGPSTYYTVLNAAGQLAGYRKASGSSAERVGYIDYTASTYDVDSKKTYYGIQMQAQGSLRISTPKLAISSSSNTSKTATWGLTALKNPTWVSEVKDLGNGQIGWTTTTRAIQFINGICVSCSF